MYVCWGKTRVTSEWLTKDRPNISIAHEWKYTGILVRYYNGESCYGTPSTWLNISTTHEVASMAIPLWTIHTTNYVATENHVTETPSTRSNISIYMEKQVRKNLKYPNRDLKFWLHMKAFQIFICLKSSNTRKIMIRLQQKFTQAWITNRDQKFHMHMNWNTQEWMCLLLLVMRILSRTTKASAHNICKWSWK